MYSESFFPLLDIEFILCIGYGSLLHVSGSHPDNYTITGSQHGSIPAHHYPIWTKVNLVLLLVRSLLFHRLELIWSHILTSLISQQHLHRLQAQHHLNSGLSSQSSLQTIPFTSSHFFLNGGVWLVLLVILCPAPDVCSYFL